MARSIDGGLEFEIKEGATLGGIPVYHYVEMPRLLDENGKPRLDIFVFRSWFDVRSVDFVKGQYVELTLPK